VQLGFAVPLAVRDECRVVAESAEVLERQLLSLILGASFAV
jgi:hypothetical protein